MLCWNVWVNLVRIAKMSTIKTKKIWKRQKLLPVYNSNNKVIGLVIVFDHSELDFSFPSSARMLCSDLTALISIIDLYSSFKRFICEQTFFRIMVINNVPSSKFLDGKLMCNLKWL